MKLYRNAAILIVDDDEDDHIILSGYLRDVPANTFSITWAPTYSEGLAQLSTDKYDIAFVDYRLGARSGVDFLKDARDLQLDTPIVLLTGQGNYSVDLEAMELGAVDYLIKADLNAEKAERCIRYTIDRANNLRALRDSEKKYRSIFERSKDIIFVADNDLRITDINKAVATMLGFDPDELYGTPLPDIVYYEDARRYLHFALEKGTSVTDLSLAMKKKDGGKLYCTLSFSCDADENGEKVVHGMIHDMTTVRKAELTTLQNEKLAATSRLVRTLAHEVRNPLNNITMSAEQLGDPSAAEDHHLYLDIIKRNSVRINNLITELLHSHIPRDNARRSSCMQDILNEVLTTAMDRLTLKKIQHSATTPDTPIYIPADRENLKIALLNIVINAIEAMTEDTGRLTLDLSVVDDDAVLSISDNGCGISEEHIDRIFEPYFTRKRTGTGLGLAFTLNIIRAHNATLDVSSTPGNGTTFTITFPQAKNDA
ncbi:response regulator [Nemorincola caseinilytica]|uniref:histidine kinase n=1 Tax=Nemorincola caseinilytica TaxID=2054315 RepID=A0ABP8N4F5_9BACT